MPSPFDITAASNTVTLDNNRSGIASFTAKNNTRRRIHATAKLAINLADDKQPISTVPPDAPKWLTIAPPPPGSTDSADSREFPIDGTQSYQVNILVPMTAPAASYKIKLTLADEVNPDDNYSDSPELIFTVREIPKPVPKPFPIWIIAAIIIVIIVIIAIVVIAVTSSSNANDNATKTAVAAAIQTSAAQTAVAATLTAQASQTAIAGQQTAVALTAAAQQTIAAQTAVAQQTQTALNVFLGSWIPVSSSGSVSALTIDDAGNNRVNITYSSPCPPNQNLCLTTGPQTFKINGVPFNPSQLAAGIGNTTFLIVPANGNQIIVTVSIAGSTSSQNFKRVFTIPIGVLGSPVLSLNNTVITDTQLGILRGFSADTPTPAP